MAYVYRKNDAGRWYIGFRDARGDWRQKATTAKTKSAAERLALDLEAKAERQRSGLEPIPVPDGGGAWVELVAWYGENYAATQPNYRRWLSTSTKHLRAAPMAGLSVSEVTAEFLASVLQSKQRDGYSPQTVNNIRALVSVIFTRAKEAGRWRGPNPAKEDAQAQGSKACLRLLATARGGARPGDSAGQLWARGHVRLRAGALRRTPARGGRGLEEVRRGPRRRNTDRASESRPGADQGQRRRRPSSASRARETTTKRHGHKWLGIRVPSGREIAFTDAGALRPRGPASTNDGRCRCWRHGLRPPLPRMALQVRLEGCG